MANTFYPSMKKFKTDIVSLIIADVVVCQS